MNKNNAKLVATKGEERSVAGRLVLWLQKANLSLSHKNNQQLQINLVVTAAYRTKGSELKFVFKGQFGPLHVAYPHPQEIKPKVTHQGMTTTSRDVPR